MSRDRISAIALGGIALLVFIGTQLLFSDYCDGRLSVFDPVLYGENIVHVTGLGADPMAVATQANHLLYHLSLFGLESLLATLGASAPGHAATRVIAGLGAAGCVVVIASFAGRRRLGVGMLAAGTLIAGRGFWFDAAAGETVLPAAALCLWALRIAVAARPRLWSLALVTTAAVLARQDSILFVPGVLWLAWPGTRPLALLGALAAGGVLCWLTYFVVWSGHALQLDFLQYVLGLGHSTEWSLRNLVGVSSGRLMIDAFITALVGRHWDFGTSPVILMVGFLATLAASARLLRGSSGIARFLVAVALVLLGRVGFFLWFEPENWEWQVPNLALLAATVAAAAHGEPRTPGAPQWAGRILLIGLSLGIAAGHAADTLRAREARLARAVTLAIETAGRDAHFFSLGHKADWLIRHAGLSCTPLDPGHGLAPEPPEFDHHVGVFVQAAAAVKLRAVLVVDCFVRDGQPISRDRLARLFLDHGLTSDSENVRILVADGVPFALFSPGE